MRPTSLCFTIWGNYVRDLNLEIWVGSLLKYLEPFGVSPGPARVMLSRMVKQGWLLGRREGANSYYKLSDKGKRRVLDGVARVFDSNEEHWDRTWQIVACQLEDVEKNRRFAALKELQWMGYGRIGTSTWISPHPRYAQLKVMMDEYGLNDRVHVFSGPLEGLGTAFDLIHQAWNINEIEMKYEEFLQTFSLKYQKLYQDAMQGSIRDEGAFMEKTLLAHEYRKFLFLDPRFPRELLPSNWAGERARILFQEYHAFLSPLAEKYFYDHLKTPQTET